MATRITIDDLNPKATDWIVQASDEHLRRDGRFRDLVLRMLASEEETQPEANGVWTTRIIRKRRATEPTDTDLIAAYNESSDPLPTPIVDYIVKHHLKGLPRKTGPKVATRSTWDEVMIIAFYQHQLGKAAMRKRFDITDAPATRAKTRTAKKFGLSVRTISSIIAPRSLVKSPPKK